MTTEINLETIVAWGKPKRVDTSKGPKNLRKAMPTEAFSAAWKADKEALRAAGISWSKEQDGQWRVCWWQPLDAAELAKIAKAEARKAVSTACRISTRPACLWHPWTSTQRQPNRVCSGTNVKECAAYEATNNQQRDSAAQQSSSATPGHKMNL